MCSFVVDSKAYKSVSTQNSGEKALLAIKLQKEVRYQRNYVTWTSLKKEIVFMQFSNNTTWTSLEWIYYINKKNNICNK